MNDFKKGKPIDILLVEDSPGDVRLVEEALKEFKFYNALFVVNDGAEAMDFLTQNGKYADVPLPDLILLDLNLPKKDGYQVLREIKGDKKLKTIPVIVLTVSKTDEDILKSYKLQANCFISKPVDVNEFFKTMKSIEDFWLTIVKLPSKREKNARLEHTAKILLVDDSAAQRLLCQKELEEEYEIITAADGPEAIECLKKEKVDLVVLDINMPRMDGMEVLGQILSLKPGLPIILYSGFDSYRDSFMSWAADAYVKKVDDISELKSKIEHLLNRGQKD